ncbi:MAG: HAD-IB family hydrolase [Chloroflexi bacterium]|nr:HAD-IB family hydrolase [Chloroflexota bacterium]
MATVGAFFDIDGTLCLDGSVWRGLWDYHFSHRRRRLRLLRFLFGNASRSAALARQGADRDAFVEASLSHLAAIFAGLSPEEGQEILHWTWQRGLRPRLRGDVVGRLREHQSQGHFTALVSATFAELAALVARELGADAAVGSRLEVDSSRYSGRMLLPVCFGPEKARQASLLAEQQSIDLAASFAYGDRGHDAPILALAGHPVAVYPDPPLLALARARGWEVLGTPRPR